MAKDYSPNYRKNSENSEDNKPVSKLADVLNRDLTKEDTDWKRCLDNCKLQQKDITSRVAKIQSLPSNTAKDVE